MTEETKETNTEETRPRELIAPGSKAVQDAIDKSIQARAQSDSGDYGIGGLGLGGLLTYMTNAGELVSPWWSTQRDIDLRRFVKGSDHLSGTVALLTSKVVNVPFRVEPRDYSLKAHIKQADEYQRILVEESEFGQGWVTLASKVLDDWMSTDNGLFLEIIGDGKKDGPIKGPALGLAALDSTRIIRKRDPEFPIGYIDEDGTQYRLHYTRVAYASDQPSNIVEMRGVGFCSVSRCINVTQRLVDMSLFFQEKLGSRPLRAVMFTPGIPTDVVEATLRMSAEILDNQALRRFSTIPVLGGNDTNARFELIPLSTLPDGFDEEISTRLCMFAQALAFGVPIRWIWPAATSGATKADAMYQHIAGLGGGIGRVLKTLTLILGGDPRGRRHTVGKFLPPHLKLVFDFQDDEQDRQKAEIKKVRTETSVAALESGIITLRVAREQALEAGDLTQAQFDAMELADGRLPSGEDVMTLFYVADDVMHAMLDLGVVDPLNVVMNDRDEMIEAIEEKQAEVRQFLGTASSVSRKQTAKQALAALGKLREAYEQQQSAQQQADDSETEEQAEGRDQPDNVDEENVDEKRPSESSESSDMNDADQGNEQEEEETEDEMKVWDSISDVPSHLTSMNGAKLTLLQINHLARIADAIEEGGQVENAWAVARNQFKKIYKKDGDKWVRREKKKGIVGRIIDGIKGDGIKGGPGSGHWGHAGRPGERGGSSPGKISSSTAMFSSFQDAHEWGKKAWKGVYDSLSTNEKNIIRDYSGNAYEEVNRYLRTGDDPDAFWIDETIRSYGSGSIDDWFSGRVSTDNVVSNFTGPLDRAIEIGTVPEQVVVFRGLGTIAGAALSRGDIFTDKAYISTSLLEDVALTRFAAKGGFVARITIPKGANALYIGGIAHRDIESEAELLLGRGSKFLVKDISDIGDVSVIEMELVND